jgi:hypothetical protein
MSGTLDPNWTAAAIGALLIAFTFAIFVPNAKKIDATTGVKHFLARWGHSLVWVLLAISFLMYASRNDTLMALAGPISAMGGILYFLFMVSFLRL